MNGTRRERLSLDQFFKQSWPIVSVGAVLLVGVMLVIGWAAMNGVFRRVSAAPIAEGATSSTLIASPVDSRALDGAMVEASSTHLLPFAIMVENHPDARPLSGVAKANVVYEFPVEGGITRFLLLVDPATNIEEIGPVRSARPYFVELADAYHALYAHVGGSPDALTRIASFDRWKNVDEMKTGTSFWRSAARVMPHNAYTSTALLQATAEKKSWMPGVFRSWFYKDDATMEKIATSTARGHTDGPTIPYGGSYEVNWTYDRATNLYARKEGGVIQKDADGTPVAAKNILILRTDGTVLDSYGRLDIRTTGKGSGTLYRDGESETIFWRRTTGETYHFEHLDGTDAILNRGTTWVEIALTTSTTP